LEVDQLAKGATHPAPFVQYTWGGRRVTFAASGDYADPTKTFFMTVLGGLSATKKGPDDMGSIKIEKLWKDRCALSAGAMYL
jgi:hypothetical protein